MCRGGKGGLFVTVREINVLSKLFEEGKLSTLKIRNLLSRARAVELLKSWRVLRFSVSHSTLVYASLLSLILFLAFVVRLLPLRWGFFLSEFDPHWHYRLTKHIVDNGFLSWASDWSVVIPSSDMMSWYPWGRDVAASSLPGLAFTAAALYQVANVLGLSFSLSAISHI